MTAARRPAPRVVDSYDGVPCTKVRPVDAPSRPGEPCGEIHEHCRGHVRRDTAANYGDPCGSTALPGILTCVNHGGQLPESAAIVKRERAARLVGQLVGTGGGPVEDPLRELARVLGEKRAWRDGLRELVAKIQTGTHRDGDGGENLLIEPGGPWYRYDSDGEVVDAGTHPDVTGSLLVRDPAGHYVVHPLVEMAERADRDYTAALAAAAKLGIEERMARLEEEQIDLALAAVRRMLELMGADPDTGLGLFLQAARDVDALSGTVTEAIEAHVVRAVDEPASGPVWP